MSIAEQLREEGKKEGIEKGIEKGIKQIAKKAIIKGYDVEEIVELTGLTEKEIKEVRKEMLKDRA